MSDNFWDVKLSEKEELAEQKKEDDSKTKATTPVPKVEVDLADSQSILGTVTMMQTKLSIGITKTV